MSGSVERVDVAVRCADAVDVSVERLRDAGVDEDVDESVTAPLRVLPSLLIW